MADKRGLQLPIELFREFTQFKIRIAGDLGHVPTNPEVTRAALAVAVKYYDETLALIDAFGRADVRESSRETGE